MSPDIFAKTDPHQNQVISTFAFQQIAVSYIYVSYLKHVTISRKIVAPLARLAAAETKPPKLALASRSAADAENTASGHGVTYTSTSQLSTAASAAADNDNYHAIAVSKMIFPGFQNQKRSRSRRKLHLCFLTAAKNKPRTAVGIITYAAQLGRDRKTLAVIAVSNANSAG